MPELPASVRLSLWTTHAWATGGRVEDVVRRALPDVDHVAGDLDRLGLWRELGERALLVALPAPGDLTGMPGASAEAHGAAAAAGECVFVPGLGGMLVPSFTEYGASGGGASGPGDASGGGRASGPSDASGRGGAAGHGGAAVRRAAPLTGSLDVGTRVDWVAYDAQPVPRHRVEALEVSQLERHLREEIRLSTQSLLAVGGQPFAAEAARELADAAVGGRWGLPAGLPGRAARVISLTGTVGQVVDVALAAGDGALTAAEAATRHRLLLELQRTADRALADATNAACAVLAGWRPE